MSSVEVFKIPHLRCEHLFRDARARQPKVLGIVVGSLLTLLVAAAVIKKGAIGVTQP